MLFLNTDTVDLLTLNLMTPSGELMYLQISNTGLIVLFPWIRVGKLLLRAETTDYTLLPFVKISKAEMTGVKEELSGLRLTVM